MDLTGGLGRQQPPKAQSPKPFISFFVSESARGYTPAKTVWGFGVIPMDTVSQRQIIPSGHWVQKRLFPRAI